MAELISPSPSTHSDNVTRVFHKLTNGGDKLTEDQFVHALTKELSLNLSKEEAKRLFLQQADQNFQGVVSLDVFQRAARDSVFLTRIVSSLSHTCEFSVPATYDFTQPTTITHRHPSYVVSNEWGTNESKIYDETKHGTLHGDFVDVRKTLDYSWHPNYTKERQLWQDVLVKDVAQRQSPSRWPWLVLTCGAMGAGKGYCLRWLSRTGVFPLDRVVKIDPDHFKSAMPEWPGYTTFDAQEKTTSAGNQTHKESGFIQELCQTVSLRLRQNTWIDGSLQDHAWWSEWIRGIRDQYPWYRIAIFYVYASDRQVLDRAKRRGEQTGRYIEETKLLESIEKTATSIKVLGPLADFVAKINNSGSLPKLDVFEDRSHSFRAISDRFRSRIDRTLRFPESLGTMWLRPVEHSMFRKTRGDSFTWDELMEKGLRSVPLCFLLTPETIMLGPSLHLLDVVPKDSVVSVTEISPTTLDDHSRSIAGIPASADWFGWTHGLIDLELKQKIAAQFDVGSHSILQLLVYGGYLYFEEKERRVVAVNAVCPQGSESGGGGSGGSGGGGLQATY